MSERKHKRDGGEKKAIQPHREEEQKPEKKPTEALTLLSANAAQPSDIQTLQRTIGNKAVTNMIQRAAQDGEFKDLKVNKLVVGQDAEIGGWVKANYGEIKRDYLYVGGKRVSASGPGPEEG